jgi:hypothetical protein
MDLNIKDISEPVDKNDKACAPDKLFENGSCYTLVSLIQIATAYNKDNPNSIIQLDPKYETLHPHKYKKYLVKNLKNKLKSKCNNQKCWLDQSFMRHVEKNDVEEIEKHTFRPDGPSGKFEWLNTVNIDEVMEQYETKYPDFKYLGTVPMDFDDLEVLGIKNMDYGKLVKEGKTKIGIVFNLDEHWKSGSHWVALYADLKEGKIYYFDSYGIRPEQRVRKLMNRINRFCQTGLGITNTDVDFNRIRHQYKNSECGVYSMNFIIRSLKGKSFKSICDSKIPDDKINKCRAKYFTIKQK